MKKEGRLWTAVGSNTIIQGYDNFATGEETIIFSNRVCHGRNSEITENVPESIGVQVMADNIKVDYCPVRKAIIITNKELEEE